MFLKQTNTKHQSFLDSIARWQKKYSATLYYGCPIPNDNRMDFERYLDTFLNCDVAPDIQIFDMEQVFKRHLTKETFDEYKKYALWRWNNAAKYRAEKRLEELDKQVKQDGLDKTL